MVSQDRSVYQERHARISSWPGNLISNKRPDTFAQTCLSSHAFPLQFDGGPYISDGTPITIQYSALEFDIRIRSKPFRDFAFGIAEWDQRGRQWPRKGHAASVSQFRIRAWIMLRARTSGNSP